MSRLNRFLHSVASGYVLLVVNGVYTLASIPLALHFLAKEEFGVWALAFQVTIYLSLIDFGMAPSITRILIDYKDRTSVTAYGSAVRTAWGILGVQGVIILAAGLLLLPPLAPYLRVPAALEAQYRMVVSLEVVILSIRFLTKIFSLLLESHQKLFVVNYAQIIAFAASYVVLALGFRNNLGLLSMPIAHAGGLIVSTGITMVSCVLSGVLPARDKWGNFSPPLFRELFVLGRDTFLVLVGAQLIMASQVVLISRHLGLAHVATWSICTRVFFFASQAIWRLFDYSIPAFAEMLVRQENDRLNHRLRALVMLTGMLSAVACVLLVVGNRLFVNIWTNGKLGWSLNHDILLGVWLIFLSIFHCHGMFVITTKKIRFMRYVYILEGICFIILACLAMPRFGLPGMIACSIVCGICFHGSYGIMRTSRFLQTSWRAVAAGWQRPMVIILTLLIPWSILVDYAGAALPDIWHLLLNVTLVGGLGLCLLAKWGVDPETKRDLACRFPVLQRIPLFKT